jgi:hypothetical protein
LPDVLNASSDSEAPSLRESWIELGRSGRQQDPSDISRHLELVGGVPPGAVEDEGGMGALGDLAADLVEMGLHGAGVGIWHGQARPDAARRADDPEQIGALVALIRRLTGSGATPGPLADDAVLLANTSLVLEPDLDRLVLGQMAQMGVQCRFEVFLKAVIVSAFWPGWRGRALMWEKPSRCRMSPTLRS